MPVPSNPFAEFSKTLSEMKWPAMDLPDAKWPAIDFSAFAEMQRKNFEAVGHANRVAMDGFRALVERQAEIAQNSANEAQSAIRKLSETGKGPGFEDQVDAARNAMERATGDLRELQDIVARSQSEVFDILNQRMMEAMDEMRAPVAKAAKKG